MSYNEQLNEAMDAGEIAFLILNDGRGRLAVTFDILEKHKLNNGDVIQADKMRAITTIHEPELKQLLHNLKTLYERVKNT